MKLSGFSRRLDYAHCRRTPEGLTYCRGSARDVDLPATLNAYALQPAIPSAGGTATTASPHRPYRQYGNVNPSAIGFSIRMSLRTRLTLIRLALIRKPWSFGGRVSRPPYRYLCLHLLFQKLQRALRRAFKAAGMLPYHHPAQGGESTASVTRLMPDHYPRTTARLVSCYALFK